MNDLKSGRPIIGSPALGVQEVRGPMPNAPHPQSLQGRLETAAGKGFGSHSDLFREALDYIRILEKQIADLRQRS